MLLSAGGGTGDPAAVMGKKKKRKKTLRSAGLKSEFDSAAGCLI
jgi:hypothetical protein